MQAPSAVVMVRPHHFSPNHETAADNVFQTTVVKSLSETRQKAYDEVSGVIETLSIAGVKVYPFDDKGTLTPDSVFPNNWFSTHACGTLVTYPMYCQNRRLEINPVIIDKLAEEFFIERFVDYAHEAEKQRYLEGTGAMVLDHDHKIAYAVRSNRLEESLFDEWCVELGYTPCIFNACDDNGVPVYHTNVLMCVANEFVLIGLDMITSLEEQAQVVNTIKASGKQVITLSTRQIHQFAGNALEVNTPSGRALIMSKTAVASLTNSQKSLIEQFVEVIAVNIPTIEQAGGSIRCMLAGIHLTPRHQTK